MRQYNLVVISGSQSHPTFNNTSGSPIVWNAHLRITVVMERKTRVPKIAKNMGCRDPLWVVISCIFGDLTTDSSACSCNEARRKERQCQRKPEHPVNLKYTVYASVAFAYVRLAEYMASACMCDIIPRPFVMFLPCIRTFDPKALCGRRDCCPAQGTSALESRTHSESLR